MTRQPRLACSQAREISNGGSGGYLACYPFKVQQDHHRHTREPEQHSDGDGGQGNVSFELGWGGWGGSWWQTPKVGHVSPTAVVRADRCRDRGSEACRAGPTEHSFGKTDKGCAVQTCGHGRQILDDSRLRRLRRLRKLRRALRG
eukprot:scaffold20777_cov62-Phaeocystis_antarctica.AAC.2